MANPPAAGRFAFKQRVSFTLERGRLKTLLQELKEDRLSLQVVIKGLKTQREYMTLEPSRQATRMARRLTNVQAMATPLFSALCRSSACNCRIKHSVMTRLEGRLLPQTQPRKLGKMAEEPPTFELVLPLEGPIFQQALVNALTIDNEFGSGG